MSKNEKREDTLFDANVKLRKYVRQAMIDTETICILSQHILDKFLITPETRKLAKKINIIAKALRVIGQ